MFISTIDTTANTPQRLDAISHARQSWSFYIDGARAGMRNDNPARTARCLEAAATWRATLAGHLVHARQSDREEAQRLRTPRPPSPMTRDELLAAMADLDWSAGILGRRTGTTRQFIQAMREGRKPVPERIAAYVRRYRLAAAKVPACAPPAATEQDQEAA